LSEALKVYPTSPTLYLFIIVVFSSTLSEALKVYPTSPTYLSL